MTLRIHHTGISTPDLSRLVAFYCDVLGFEEVARADWEQGFADADDVLGLTDSAAAMVLLQLGDSYLEVFQFHQPDPGPPDTDRPVSKAGINHICLAVVDVAAEHERLLGVGMRFHSSPRDIGDGPFVYGRDPDGNVVELWQVGSP